MTVSINNKWIIIACLSVILTGCAGMGGDAQFGRHKSKAIYPGHGDQEIDISALAMVDLGLTDWAEITGKKLDKKIFLGFRGEEESEYSAVTLLPGIYQFLLGSDFAVSIFLGIGSHVKGTVNILPIYLEAGHTYRLQMDRSSGSLPIRVYGGIYDITVGAYVNHRCLSEKREALSRVKVRAESGDADAQYLLGKWHQTGECDGAIKDYAIAIAWLEKSASQGTEKAQLELAKIYEYGKAGEINVEKARNWYEKAATQGSADASYILGRIYQDGSGVEKNLEISLKWYQKSADQGFSYALKKVESVKKEIACTKNSSCTDNTQTE